MSIPQATSTTSGFLYYGDWVRFNNNSGSLPFTSKGDLITYTGSVVVRLPVGTNGYVLTADSTQTNGLNWTSASGSSFTIGNLDAQAGNSQGLSFVSSVLSQQSASSSNPGLVNNTTQTFSGNKTLSGTTNLSGLTASTALALDGSKNIVSSSTTGTELGYVHGVTSALQTQINGLQPSGNYLTALTGDVTASGPGSSAATVAQIQGKAVSGTTGTTNVVFSASPTLSGTVNIGTGAGVIRSTSGGALSSAELSGDVTTSGSNATTVSKIQGTSVSGVTGTGNVVLSASPTLTGTIAAANMSLSGTTANSLLLGQASSAITSLTNGSQYQSLIANSSGAPSFQALNLGQSAAISGTLPLGNGGTGQTSFGTGLVRSSGSALSSAELSGDVTTSASNATTVAKIQGTSVTGTTGTGNVVLSASPTHTGTVTMASATVSGTLVDGNYNIQPGEFGNGNSGTALTINWGATGGSAQKVTLTGNCTFTFSNPQVGGAYFLRLVQDATGSRTVTWPSSVHWFGGTAPTLTTTATQEDDITCYYTSDSSYHCSYQLNVVP